MSNKFCKHVYQDVEFDPCEYCGRDSHKINWDLYMKQRKDHRDKYGILYNKMEWWSI